MKKKILIVIVCITCIVTAVWAASKVTLHDTCEKGCTITATEHKCGVCGTSMSHSNEYKNGYLITTYKCKNSKCNHTCYTEEKR